mmetsp:Transcript_2050/g.2493  ORF Transcript_2050/g.2493 Transcript_2050/m.2493 type:complete len:122 (+) Transcript_2050:246-611(+)
MMKNLLLWNEVKDCSLLIESKTRELDQYNEKLSVDTLNDSIEMLNLAKEIDDLRAKHNILKKNIKYIEYMISKAVEARRKATLAYDYWKNNEFVTASSWMIVKALMVGGCSGIFSILGNRI